MNNTFNIKRFTLLFKKHTIEHAKTYLLSVIVLMGLIFIALGFNSYTNRGLLDKDAQMLTFMFILLAGGSIFTSMGFIDLGDKKKAIPFLTLPASHFEKYLVSWLYSYVIFQLIFIAAFYVVDITVIRLGTEPIDERDQLFNIFSPDDRYSTIFLLYAFLNGLALWGAVFFEKMHFIKTAVVFFICLTVMIALNNHLLHLFAGKDLEGQVPFQGAGVNDQVHFWRIYPDKSITQIGVYIIALMAGLLWISAYFRLKEKEV
jgi:hypothetical protein